jgi:hypothetical protein
VQSEELEPLVTPGLWTNSNETLVIDWEGADLEIER